MKIFLFYILLINSFSSFSQDSLNMEVLFHWDDSTITSYQNWGNMAQQYNEIWGYYDSTKNREYAIIGSAEGTYIWDVTNTDSSFLADYELGYDTADIHRDFKIYKNYLYGVADEGFSSLQIFDMSYLPDSVHKVYDSQEFVIRSHNCYIDEGRLYLCSPDYLGGITGLRILDIATNPEKPRLLKDYDINLGSGNMLLHDLFVRDSIAYCSYGHDGLFVLDVSDLNNISTLGSITSYSDQDYNHSSWLSDDNRTLYFVDEKHGKRIKAFDVTDFSNMEELSLFESNPGAMPHNVFVKGDKLYVSYYHDGVWVFDVSDRKNPTTIAYYDTFVEPDGYDSYQGSWGVYPYLPSGNILVSDFANGLFVLSDTSVTKEPPTGITEEVKSIAKLVPNLVSKSTFLNLPIGMTLQRIEVFNQLGQNVYYEDINEVFSVKQFDFSILEKGNYIMQLIGENSNESINFVKQ